MKKALFALMLILSALPAFAQRYPTTCQAAAIDRYNRLIARFYGRVDYRTGQCREALRNCSMEIRRRGWYDAHCVQLRDY
jgi:hypothetical protein